MLLTTISPVPGNSPPPTVKLLTELIDVLRTKTPPLTATTLKVYELSFKVKEPEPTVRLLISLTVPPVAETLPPLTLKLSAVKEPPVNS